MKKKYVRAAVGAMEEAYSWIVSNITPGTHGKLEASAKLRHDAKLSAYCWSVGSANGFKRIKHN
ncbi:MAG: hypothetical protein ABI216_21970 [Devosia sp.]